MNACSRTAEATAASRPAAAQAAIAGAPSVWHSLAIEFKHTGKTIFHKVMHENASGRDFVCVRVHALGFFPKLCATLTYAP
jgi:hypothetical protein